MGCGCNRNKGRVTIQNKMTMSSNRIVANSLSNICPRCGSGMRVFNKFDSNSKRMVRKSTCINNACKYSI